MDAFGHLVGQDKAKKRLNHYLKLFSAKGISPFLMLNGAKGGGKTEIARSFARELKDKNGSNRPIFEINCSTIKNVSEFFEQIFLQFIFDNEVTIFFDECHELPKCLTNAFLTIFNIENSSRREFRHGDDVYEFDFSRQTFLFATTELDKVFPPLVDRLTVIELEEYKQNELATIIKNVCSQISIDEQTLENLVKRTRGNARSAVKLGKEVENFCIAEQKNTFGAKEFLKFIDVLGFNLHGISNIEKQILKILEKKNCSLQEIAAKTGLSRTAIQKEKEVYLLKLGLMSIDGKRGITMKGREVLKV